MKEIDSFTTLIKLLNLFQKVGQLSWNSNQAKNRYPAPEAMTKEEVTALTRLYLALTIDLMELGKEAKKIKNEYNI